MFEEQLPGEAEQQRETEGEAEWTKLERVAAEGLARMAGEDKLA
jgi:hypothetical protein